MAVGLAEFNHERIQIYSGLPFWSLGDQNGLGRVLAKKLDLCFDPVVL